MSWLADLIYDPIPPLLTSEHAAIIYWTKKDLLGEVTPGAKDVLWDLPIPRKILRTCS